MTRPCPKHDKCVHRLGKGHPGRCLEYDEVTQKRSWIMLDDPGWNEIEHIAPEAAPIVEQPNIMCIDGSNAGVAPSSIHNDDDSSLNEAGAVLRLCFHCLRLIQHYFSVVIVCADVNTEPCPKHDKCIHPQGKGHRGRCTYYDDATHRRTFILPDDPGWKVERKEPSKPKEDVCERPVLRTRPSKQSMMQNNNSGDESMVVQLAPEAAPIAEQQTSHSGTVSSSQGEDSNFNEEGMCDVMLVFLLSRSHSSTCVQMLTLSIAPSTTSVFIHKVRGIAVVASNSMLSDKCELSFPPTTQAGRLTRRSHRMQRKICWTGVLP